MDGAEVFEYALTVGWYRVVVDAQGVSVTPHRKKGGESFPSRHVSFAELDRVVLRQRSNKRRQSGVVLLKSRGGKNLSVYVSVLRNGTRVDDSRTQLAAAAAILRRIGAVRPDLQVETDGADPAYLIGAVIGAVISVFVGGLLDGPWTTTSWIVLAVIIGVLAFGIVRGGLFRKVRRMTALDAISRLETPVSGILAAQPAH